MSKPNNYKSGFVNGAMLEIISGRSALNMPPEPIPENEQEPDNNGYLSDIDGMVKHSMEHFRQAHKLLIKENERQFKIAGNISRTINNISKLNNGELTKEYVLDALWRIYWDVKGEKEL